MRQSKTDKTVTDLTVPINKDSLKQDGCFGKEWDVTTQECKVCADRDVCGILFKDRVDSKAKELEEKDGNKFLDMADFDFSEEELKVIDAFIISGETTTNELVRKIMELANSSDQVAGVENTKRYIKSNPNIYSKDGKVWKR